MTTISIKEFYSEVFGKQCSELNNFLDQQNNQDIGHFNVFDIEKMQSACKNKPTMPYNRRNYYKISFIKGENRVEYADKIVDIKDSAILFATPKIPYRYVPIGDKQAGHFCVFTADFLAKSKTGFSIDELPVFRPQSNFIYQLSKDQQYTFTSVFEKMHSEMGSNYPYKYDLLRNYVLELILQGQKLEPMAFEKSELNASARIFTLFIELLERQFPIESPTQVLELKTAKDYADMLQVHVNHLNKVLKETTGKTTTEIITSRINQEAKVLLKQTTWNISEIAYSLGFDEVSNFSNFFKKNTSFSPISYRE